MEDIFCEDSKKFLVEAAGGVVVLVAGEGREGGRVLMMMRRGVWDLPKGHLDEGETLRECALREVCEECGLDPALVEVGDEIARTVHSYRYEPLGRHEEKHTTWFAMSYSGDPRAVTPQAEEDITALEWLTPAEAVRAAATSYTTIREVIEKLNFKILK